MYIRSSDKQTIESNVGYLHYERLFHHLHNKLYRMYICKSVGGIKIYAQNPISSSYGGRVRAKILIRSGDRQITREHRRPVGTAYNLQAN